MGCCLKPNSKPYSSSSMRRLVQATVIFKHQLCRVSPWEVGSILFNFQSAHLQNPLTLWSTLAVTFCGSNALHVLTVTSKPVLCSTLLLHPLMLLSDAVPSSAWIWISVAVNKVTASTRFVCSFVHPSTSFSLCANCHILRAAPAMLSMQKYFLHPNLVIYFFPTPPIKTKTGTATANRWDTTNSNPTGPKSL